MSQQEKRAFSYRYQTSTLNDSSGYSFRSEGLVGVPSLQSSSLYEINALSSVIHYKDQTAGVGFSNMQRNLYNNFIEDFDLSFIKDHEFRQNYAYQNDDPDIVQFMFHSDKYEIDEGYMLFDKLACVIL